MAPPEHTKLPRHIRVLPWLAGLLIGATAHIVWWTNVHADPTPQARVVAIPSPSIEIPITVVQREPAEAEAEPVPRRRGVRGALGTRTRDVDTKTRRSRRRARARARHAASCDRAATRPASTPDGAQGAVVCNPEGCSIRRDFLERLPDQPQLLSGQARLRPEKSGDAMIGLRLLRVDRGSVLDLLGFRSGDVIKAIDGRPLRSFDETLEAFQHFGEADALTVELSHNGVTRRRRYAIIDG